MPMQCHNDSPEKHTICLVTRLSNLHENSLCNAKKKQLCACLMNMWALF